MQCSCCALTPSLPNSDRCWYCLAVGCDPSLDSCQCRPDAELEPETRKPSEIADDEALRWERWQERDEREQERRDALGPRATFAREGEE